jgi:hydroxymethylglutaryl-CoA reductase
LALVTEGIQKGHMNLHSKNFAIEAGVPINMIPEAILYMKNHKKISL